MVADLCLGGRGVDRFRKLVGLFQPFGKTDAAYGAVLLVAGPAASGDVAADDTLDGKHVQLPAHHGLALELLLLEEFRHIGCVHRNHVVRDDILCQVEPELGHLGQYRTLLGHLIVEDHIEAADAVSGNHDQAVAVVIDLTYFTFFDWF